MSTEKTKRPLLHRLFKAGLGQETLITVWITEKDEYAHGQTERETKIKIGRYTLLAWRTFHTPIIGERPE